MPHGEHRPRPPPPAPAPPGQLTASNSSCVDRWLAEALDGYCGEAENGGDCLHGDQGSWPLSAFDARSWRSAAAACTALCAGCKRCHLISTSLQWKDCTWWHGRCELKKDVAGFRTASGCAHSHLKLPRPPVIEERTPRVVERRAPLEAASSEPLWLAIGIIVGPGVKVVPPHDEQRDGSGAAGLRFYHQGFVSRLNGTVAWQWVTTESRHRSDPRFVVVPCRDGPFGGGVRGDDLTTAIASACACKTIQWFRRALHLFPNARFVAKAEDDSALHDARIVAELRSASLRYGSSAMLWYGYFQWSGLNPASRRNGWYCGEGDNHMLRSSIPHCPQPRRSDGSVNIPAAAVRREAGGGGNDNSHAGGHHHQQPSSWGADEAESLAVAPFASGGLDIRSRSLAELVASVGFDVKFAHEWTSEGAHGGCEDYQETCGANDWAAACDGLQGYVISRTLHLAKREAAAPNVTVLHLTGSKFHYPPPGVSTSVMHGMELKSAKDWKAPPSAWRYHHGSAMMPIPLRLFPTAGGIGWQAEDRRQVEAFHARRNSPGAGCEGDSVSGKSSGMLPCADIPPDAELHVRL